MAHAKRLRSGTPKRQRREGRTAATHKHGRDREGDPALGPLTPTAAVNSFAAARSAPPADIPSAGDGRLSMQPAISGWQAQPRWVVDGMG